MTRQASVATSPFWRGREGGQRYGMIRVLGILLWRNPAKVVLVLVPLLLALIMFLGREQLFVLSDWKRASGTLALLASFFISPLAASLAGWVAAGVRRHGLVPLLRTCPRPWLTVAGLEWSATAAWSLVFLGLTAVGVSIYAMQASGIVRPWPSYLVVGAMAVIQASAVGFMVGQVFPWTRAAPLLSAIVALAPPIIWIALTVSGQDVTGLERLLLIGFGHETEPWLRLRPSVMALMACWSATVSLAALLIAASGRLPLRIRVLLVAMMLIVITGVAHIAIIWKGSNVEPVPEPEEIACAGESPQVCVWPEHRWAIPVVQETLKRLRAVLGERYRLPTVLYEQYLPGAPQRGQPIVRLAGYEGQEVSTTLLYSLLEGLLPATPTDLCAAQGVSASDPAEYVRVLEFRYPGRLQRWALMRAWLERRVLGREVSVWGVNTPADKQLRMLLALPDERQREWFWEQIPAIQDCSRPMPPMGLPS